MKRFMFIFSLVALVPLLAFGLPEQAKRPAPVYPAMVGSETVAAPSMGPVAPQVPGIDEADLIGDTTTIGMTWYENQHNGSCGHMNTLETDGWRQFAWMKGENTGAVIRHIWWNGIDPNGARYSRATAWRWNLPLAVASAIWT